ncbi:MAG TPA: methyltransferase domain-containing protein [Candidatus Omnitrophota bacterium]|nr:methyltransferase domain-containing protein [Candidatus Omnitrophota bacterium]
MHINCRLVFEKYAKPFFKSNMRILEIGPDGHPSTFRQMLDLDRVRWETLDIFNDGRVTYVAADEHAFPVPDGTFDVVFSNQVIEHVRKPWLWIKENARVCKKNGRVITLCPVSWPYHEAPVDCWRIYPEGMKSLYEEAGLTLEICRLESLERVQAKEVWPGIGAVREESPKINFRDRLRRFFGWPQTVAFDTIAVGVKL